MSANILVISDTHGNTGAIKNLLDNYQGMVAAVVHLGDYSRDMSRFTRGAEGGEDIYHIVSGNTDPLVEAYDERVIEVAGKKIFITHGHRYDVKTSLQRLIYKAQELQVDACLFGHTHDATTFTEQGIVFLNPGSPTYPAPEQDRGYGLLRITEEGTITGKLLSYREPSWPGV